MCPDCFKISRSVACFDHHKKTHKSKGIDLPSKCDKSFRCQTCLVIVDKERQDEHRCGEHMGHICKRYVLSDHLCYMQPEPPTLATATLSFMTLKPTFLRGSTLLTSLSLIMWMVRNLYLRGTMH